MQPLISTVPIEVEIAAGPAWSKTGTGDGYVAVGARWWLLATVLAGAAAVAVWYWTRHRRGGRREAAEAPVVQHGAPTIPPGYAALYDAAAQQLGAQFASADALDTKAATIFSVASTIVAVVPAVLPLSQNNIKFASLTTLFLGLSVLAWLIGLALFWLTYRIGGWAGGPSLEKVVAQAQDGEDYARYWVALAYQLAIQANEPALKRKGYTLSWLMRTFVVEVVLLLVAAGSTFSR